MAAHIVPIIGQKFSMGCWAAAFAMTDSWHSNATMPIQSTLQKLGQPYVDAYAKNTGLQNNQVAAALRTLKLTREPPSNPTPDKWLQMIAGGPLLVVVDEDPHPNLFAVHARVIFEVSNDSAHMVSFNDPGGNNMQGSVRSQSLTQFVKDYEQLAGTGWAGMQIIHH